MNKICATKSDLKNETGVDTSKLAKKVDLVSLKSDVDDLHVDDLKNVPIGLSSLKSKIDISNIGKLETTPVDVSQLTDVVKSDVVKKTEYDELVKSVDIIKTTDTSDLVKKADHNKKIDEIGKNINMIMII